MNAATPKLDATGDALAAFREAAHVCVSLLMGGMVAYATLRGSPTTAVSGVRIADRMTIALAGEMAVAVAAGKPWTMTDDELRDLMVGAGDRTGQIVGPDAIDRGLDTFRQVETAVARLIGQTDVWSAVEELAAVLLEKRAIDASDIVRITTSRLGLAHPKH